MKWKVRPGEVLGYKTYMKLDTNVSDKSPLDGLLNSMDSLEMDEKIGTSGKNKQSKKEKDQREVNRAKARTGLREMMQKMRELEPEYYVTNMKAGQRGLIKIDMLPYRSQAKEPEKKEEAFIQMFSSMASAPLLQAAIHDDGTLESFYLGNEQNNILAVFFQLPSKPVKLNDTLSIPTHFVNVGAKFTCDTAYKRNKVWVADIADGPVGKVVTLKYDIEEFVVGSYHFPLPKEEMEQAGSRLQTTFHTTFKAQATFSVSEGKWLTYEGEMNVANTGMLGLGHSKKWYRLVAQ